MTKFIEKTKKRMFYCGLIAVLGVVTALIPKGIFADFTQGHQYGVSGGLIGVGIAAFFNKLITLKNKEILQREFIKETDERNIQISRAAYAVSYIITLVLLAVASLFLPSETANIFLCILGISVFSYMICYYIFKNKI
jgi:uncharacterized membrane protein